jgi:RNase P subunit RPR2
MPDTHTICPKCSDPLGKTLSVMVRLGLQLSVYKCPYCANVWATAADVPDSTPARK